MLGLLIGLLVGQCGPDGCPVQRPAQTVTIRLHVDPPDAEVFVEKLRMPGCGPLRLLVSPPLAPGNRYAYYIVARWGGVERACEAQVEPGQSYDVTLKRDMPNDSVASSPSPSDVPNFGIDLGQMGKPAERVTVNDKTITKAEAVQLLENGPLPDDEAKLRLTVIGSDADRKRVLDDLAGPLADLAGGFVVQAYAPNHWTVARAGFHTGGKPTIYIQEPGGKVLHRQDDYADGAEGLRRALEAIRKPRPDYDRAKDLDLRTPPISRRWVLIGGAGLLALLLLKRRS